MKKFFKIGSITLLAVIFISSLTLNAFDGQQKKKDKKEKDIVTTAVEAGSFTILAKALTEAGLVETLQGEGPYTVFAPTDEAFEKLPEGTLESLLEDKEALTQVLLYHVVEGNVTSEQVVELNSATTVEGSDVRVKVKGDKVMINNAKVIKADIEASNGTIHVIDKVILPPTM